MLIQDFKQPRHATGMPTTAICTHRHSTYLPRQHVPSAATATPGVQFSDAVPLLWKITPSPPVPLPELPAPPVSTFPPVLLLGAGSAFAPLLLLEVGGASVIVLLVLVLLLLPPLLGMYLVELQSVGVGQSTLARFGLSCVQKCMFTGKELVRFMHT